MRSGDVDLYVEYIGTGLVNYRADNGEDPKLIAEDFLKNKGLIE